MYCFNVDYSTCQRLQTIIYEYLSLLTSISPNSLKPKHHFLIHYPRCMYQFGPLLKLSCLHFETKNQEGKETSKSTLSRVNINKSIAIKHQLLLNCRFIKRESPCKAFEFVILNMKQLCHLKHYKQFIHLLNISIFEEISCVKFAYYIGKNI